MISDVRKNRRLQVDYPLAWKIEAQSVSGTGQMVDLSLCGACFRISKPFVAQSGLTFNLEIAELPVMPARGRLRWYRRLQGRAPSFLCGVTFITQDVDMTAWTEWIEARNASVAEEPEAQSA